jgi:hypothetical protein
VNTPSSHRRVRENAPDLGEIPPGAGRVRRRDASIIPVVGDPDRVDSPARNRRAASTDQRRPLGVGLLADQIAGVLVVHAPVAEHEVDHVGGPACAFARRIARSTRFAGAFRFLLGHEGVACRCRKRSLAVRQVVHGAVSRPTVHSPCCSQSRSQLHVLRPCRVPPVRLPTSPGRQWRRRRPGGFTSVHPSRSRRACLDAERFVSRMMSTTVPPLAVGPRLAFVDAVRRPIAPCSFGSDD